jgi:hypothetical protein
MQSSRKQPNWFGKIWRLWAKALGDKAGTTVQEADLVAIIRTAIVLVYIITNLFIIAGVIRHW